ncbi:GNAT family N-acetyltransferase [Pedosphaera parvula]|uniref:GCN5-related N-acetyltransferase n=1 Tax=Pedosphaera parvula (strain Ellin514) TaxID=320771 RepID=B9XD76_PEDPL|nr:GNAT family N-acetyltransferase [Pedosphaera parvula]EEF62022.1 GCN5-related N-acetyltransferase [Pedosphaera parvula Ellin514]
MREGLALQSTRLELLPATIELLAADLCDRAKFGCLLQAIVPASWPPPLVERSELEWLIQKLGEDPEVLPWSARYFILKDPRILIGFGGFKSRPDTRGIAEVGYAMVTDHQCKGFATEALKALCEWAFTHPEVTRIIGETYPDLTASISVLEKSRFAYADAGSEPGVVQYELLRH